MAAFHFPNWDVFSSSQDGFMHPQAVEKFYVVLNSSVPLLEPFVVAMPRGIGWDWVSIRFARERLLAVDLHHTIVCARHKVPAEVSLELLAYSVLEFDAVGERSEIEVNFYRLSTEW